jgi:hypothetical protein
MLTEEKHIATLKRVKVAIEAVVTDLSNIGDDLGDDEDLADEAESIEEIRSSLEEIATEIGALSGPETEPSTT